MTKQSGVILVDKPKGWTSFDVVAKVRGTLRRHELPVVDGVRFSNESLKANSSRRLTTKAKVRVGHAGTLDPLATGLLIVLVGSATKQQDVFMKKNKVYEAEFTLGATSTTDDAEGKIVSRNNLVKPTQPEIEEALAKFSGEQMQMPPQYSAIKIGGKKAYDIARAGKKADLKPRKVTVYNFRLVSYKFPKLKVVCEVSSGTYIRSLARDIGSYLGCGAYLCSLRRTSIGSISVDGAISPDLLTTETIGERIRSM